MMWSPVPLSPNDTSRTPSSRWKHAAVVCDDHLYLLGGRNGNLPLRDFWKWSLHTNEWVLIPPLPNNPPSLQEHTIISYEHQLYVFGGEFASSVETPLWIFNVKKHSWRKWKGQKGSSSPCGRRGHCAVLHGNIMYICGGYLDMRGSTGELWAFNLDEEVWQLLSPSRSDGETSVPAPRHTHSCVVFDKKLWIFGGMTDLQERNDFWTWDLTMGIWSCVRAKNGPSPLHSHIAVKYESSFYIIGGERQGYPTDEVWRFQFATQTWLKMDLPPQRPQPRAQMACVVIPLTLPSSEITAATISITSIGSDLRENASAGEVLLDEEQRSLCKAELCPESTIKAPLATRMWPLRRSYSLLSNSSSDLTDLIEELECDEGNLGSRVGKSQTHDSGIDSVQSGLIDSTNTLSSPLPSELSSKKPRSKTLFDLHNTNTTCVTRSYTTVRFNPFANEKQVKLIDLEETEDCHSSDDYRHRGFVEALNPPLHNLAAAVPGKDLVDFSSLSSLNNEKLPSIRKQPVRKNYVILVLGGREMGQITVFRRPLSIWKLRLQ